MQPDRKIRPLTAAIDRRRLTLEPLEQRLLLSLSPGDVSESQRDSLLGGLTGLANWAEDPVTLE